MPLYEYICQTCGERFEKMSVDPATRPSCAHSSAERTPSSSRVS